MSIKSTGTYLYVEDAVRVQPYSGKALSFILTDVQLFLFLFPFASFFVAMPEIAGAEVLINALSGLMVVLSLGYLLLMRKAHFTLRHCTALFLVVIFIIASVYWADPSMRSNSITFTARTVLTIIQTLVIVLVSLDQGDHLFKLLKRYAIFISLFNLGFFLLFPAQSVWTSDDTPRIQGIFSSPNNMGQFLAFAFLIVNFFKPRTLPLPLLLIINAILIYQFFRCDSMTSLAGIVVLLLCYHFKVLLKPLFIFIVIAGLTIPHLSKLRGSGSESLGFMNRDLTFTGRSFIWDIMLHDLDRWDREWYGFGSGGYWHEDMEQYNPVTGLYNLDFIIGQGHNGYLEIIVATGITGLIFFLIFLFDYVRRIFGTVSFKYRIVYFLTLIILFNNMTESSFFRTKHLYFVLLMLMYWYVYLSPQLGTQEAETEPLPISDSGKETTNPA